MDTDEYETWDWEGTPQFVSPKWLNANDLAALQGVVVAQNEVNFRPLSHTKTKPITT
jgi:hypothetical protein